MTGIEEGTIRLRAVEPSDLETLYKWENDPRIWCVSGTTEPFSREQMRRFIERQLGGDDLLRTGQLRLMIETRPQTDEAQNDRRASAGTAAEARTVGAIDLFDYDPIHRRAGIGILIYAVDDRSRGCASDAVAALGRYAREVLGLHQLWCNVGADNAASLRLFRRAGFTEAGVKRDWLWTPEGYRDEVLLQKLLS